MPLSNQISCVKAFKRATDTVAIAGGENEPRKKQGFLAFSWLANIL